MTQFYVSASMELHPSRELVASGQRAGRGRRAQAHVRIWSTDTLQTLHVFGMAEFETGVSAVAFSQLVSIYIIKKTLTVLRAKCKYILKGVLIFIIFINSS